MQPLPPIDRLAGVLENFRFRAQLFHSGPLCGLTSFDADEGHGYLHVLRRGQLDVSHPGNHDLPALLRLDQPTLLFYPRPLTHRFHNPPREGSDFTCARLDFEGGVAHPLVRGLPRLIVLPLARVPGIATTLQLLFDEADHIRCGQRLLTDRLFEVLVIQLLRWLLDHPQEAGIQPGFINGLSDPRLARALAAMHERPGEAWTLDRLAAQAGMSRTGFAGSFRDVVGQTPGDYLADWRITLAQRWLRQGQPIKALANRLGYANASALSRVFAARTGLSPRDWLKQAGDRESARGRVAPHLQ